MTLKKLSVILAAAIAIGISTNKRVHATIVTSSGTINGGTAGQGLLIAAPAVAGAVNVLEGCILSISSTSQANCATLSGAGSTAAKPNSGTPQIKLCAGAGASVSFGQGFASANGQNVGSIEALFNERFVSTDSIGVAFDATQSNTLLSCSYQLQHLR